MSTADGSVVIGVNMNVSDAEKQLAKLTKNIEKTEKNISDMTRKRNEAREKSSILGADIEAEHRKLEDMKKTVQEIKDVIKDKTFSSSVRQEAKLNLPEAKEAVKEQEKYVRSLESEWTKLENSVDRYDQQIRDSEEGLVSQKIAAGELQQQISEAEAEVAKLKVSDQHVVDLNKELLTLKQRQKDLESLGVGSGYEEYDQNSRHISEITKELKEYFNGLLNSEQNNYFQELASEAEIADQHITDLRQELEELKSTKKDLEKAGLGLGIQEYDEVIAQIEEISQTLKEYKKSLSQARQEEPFEQVVEDAEIASQHMVDLNQELEDLKKRQKELAGQGIGLGYQEYDQNVARIAEITKELKEYQKALSTASSSVEATQQDDSLFALIIEDAEVANQRIVDLNHELLELKQRQKELEHAGVGLGHQEYDQTLARIAEINRELSEYRSSLKKASEGAEGTARGVGRIAEESKRASGFMERFSARIKGVLSRVFVFTLMTSALRSMRTWLGNVIKTNGEATAAIARLKGALLTLAQPLVEVIIPAFTLFVNILAKVVSLIAQLVAFLFGTTLKQASDSAKALYDEANALGAVGSAAEEAAGSLAGFDEINTISTDTGGGGGGGGAVSSEIVPDFGWMDSWLLDKLKEIADLVGLIGAGLALWKLSGLLPGMLGTIAEKLAGILLTVGGLLLYWRGLTDALENGVDWLNLIEMIGGLAAAAFGLYLLLGPIAAGIALVVGGLGMLVTAFHDAFENGWNLQNLLLAIAGLLSAGLGISLLTGSWIPLLLSGIASVLLAITVATGHGEELLNGIRTMMEGFLDFFTGVFTGDFDLAVQGLIKIFSGLNTAIDAVLEGIRDAINLFLDWLDEKTGGKLHDLIETIREMVSGLIDGVEQILDGFLEFLTGVFTGNLETAISGIETIVEGLKTAISAVVDGIQNLIIGFLDWLDEKTNGTFHGIIEAAKGFVTDFFTTVKDTLNNILDAVKTILTGVIQFISGVFSGDWKLVWEGILNIFKGAWNAIVSALEGAVNLIISGVNLLIKALNKLSIDIPATPFSEAMSIGFSIPELSKISIPRLAQGAVIPANREFMAVLGDQSHGNNLEAPESLIRQIVREESGGGGEVAGLLQAILEAVKAGHIIMVDRRVLGKTVTQEQNRMTRQSGTSVLLG